MQSKITKGAKRTHEYKITILVQYTFNYQRNLETVSPFKRNCQLGQYAILTLDMTRLSFKKSLEPSHGVLQLLKKNLYSVLILHLLMPHFSVFHVLQALGIFMF